MNQVKKKTKHELVVEKAVAILKGMQCLEKEIA